MYLDRDEERRLQTKYSGVIPEAGGLGLLFEAGIKSMTRILVRNGACNADIREIAQVLFPGMEDRKIRGKIRAVLEEIDFEKGQ